MFSDLLPVDISVVFIDPFPANHPDKVIDAQFISLGDAEKDDGGDFLYQDKSYLLATFSSVGVMDGHDLVDWFNFFCWFDHFLKLNRFLLKV